MLEIIRLSTGKSGTRGALRLNKILVGVTLELPWRQNERNISCIPAGQYEISNYKSNKFKCVCLALHDVFGRSYIAIHPGERLTHTKGCILPGKYFNFEGYLRYSKAVLGLLVHGLPNRTILTITENY